MVRLRSVARTRDVARVGASTAMSRVVDTRQVAKSERMEFWLETVCENILPVEIDPRGDEEVRAAMGCAQVGPLAMREVVGSGPHVYVRDEHHVRTHDPDSFQVGIPTGGSSMLIQDGREAQLSPGDLVMWDSSRPYTVVMAESFHWHVFLLPKQKLRRSDAELRRLTAIPVRGDRGVASVVSRFLLDLATRSPELEADPTALMLGESAGDLVAALVQTQFGAPWTVGRPEQALREQARMFISDHHHEPHLDPAAIAAAVRVSVRTLHQLFATEEQSVMDVLRTTRLAEIRRELADPRAAHRSIGRIAAAHGLPNPTVFARLFKAAYGLTPREFRTQATAL